MVKDTVRVKQMCTRVKQMCTRVKFKQVIIAVRMLGEAGKADQKWHSLL